MDCYSNSLRIGKRGRFWRIQEYNQGTIAINLTSLWTAVEKDEVSFGLRRKL
jgi:hypothetical protein